MASSRSSTNLKIYEKRSCWNLTRWPFREQSIRGRRPWEKAFELKKWDGLFVAPSRPSREISARVAANGLSWDLVGFQVTWNWRKGGELDGRDCIVQVSSTMSGFGTFLLLLFLAAVFYLLAGVFIQKMKGAEGMELIPHLNFWKSLPDRVKTWFTFLKTGGRLGSDSYESI